MKQFAMRIRARFFEEMLGTKATKTAIQREYVPAPDNDRQSEEEDAIVERTVGTTVFHYMPVETLKIMLKRTPGFSIPDLSVFRAGDIRGMCLPAGLNQPAVGPDTPVCLGHWDYEFKGFLKGATGFLRNASDTLSAKVKAYKSKIDGTIFVNPRFIPLVPPSRMVALEFCERSIRVDTMQGPRVSIVSSEAAPIGTYVDLEITSITEYFGKKAKQKKGEDEGEDNGLVPVLDWLIENLNFGKCSGRGQWRNSGKGRFDYEITEAWHQVA